MCVCVCVRARAHVYVCKRLDVIIHFTSVSERDYFVPFSWLRRLNADITYIIAIIINIHAQQTTTLTLTVSESLLTKCSMHYHCFVWNSSNFSLPVKNIADTHIHKQSGTVYIMSTTNSAGLQETYIKYLS